MKDITSLRFISMPEDHFRRSLLQKILCTLPYECRWVPGVIYDAGNPEFHRYTEGGVASYLDDDAIRRKGVIGTWIAHSRALEDVEDREGYTVVMEDDFVCRADFFSRALKMVSGFDRDFDFVMFDPLGTGPLASHRIAADIYRSRGESFPHYYGTHCVLVNNRNIPKILEIKRRSTIKDVDGYLLASDTGLTNYLFYTGLCRQISFGTHTGRFQQTIPSLALGMIKWAWWTRGAYLPGRRTASLPRGAAVAG